MKDCKNCIYNIPINKSEGLCMACLVDVGVSSSLADEDDCKAYRFCDYFFSCNFNDEKTCENCIYSDSEVCPADKGAHKLICDE